MTDRERRKLIKSITGGIVGILAMVAIVLLAFNEVSIPSMLYAVLAAFVAWAFGSAGVEYAEYHEDGKRTRERERSNQHDNQSV